MSKTQDDPRATVKDRLFGVAAARWAARPTLVGCLAALVVGSTGCYHQSNVEEMPRVEFTDTGLSCGKSEPAIPFAGLKQIEFQDTFKTYRVGKRSRKYGHTYTQMYSGNVDVHATMADGSVRTVRVWRDYRRTDSGKPDELLTREWVSRSVAMMLAKAPGVRFILERTCTGGQTEGHVYYWGSGNILGDTGRVVLVSPDLADQPVYYTGAGGGKIIGRQNAIMKNGRPADAQLAPGFDKEYTSPPSEGEVKWNLYTFNFTSRPR